MGLYKFIKKSIQENYELYEEDDDDYDDDVYEEGYEEYYQEYYDYQESKNKAQPVDESEDDMISMLRDSLNRAISGNESDEEKTPQIIQKPEESKKDRFAKTNANTSQRRDKARSEESKYDDLLKEMQKKSMENAFEKIGTKDNEDNSLSDVLQREENREKQYIEDEKRLSRQREITSQIQNASRMAEHTGSGKKAIETEFGTIYLDDDESGEDFYHSQDGHHGSSHSQGGHHGSSHSQGGHHGSSHSQGGHHGSSHSHDGHHSSHHLGSGQHLSDYEYESSRERRKREKREEKERKLREREEQKEEKLRKKDKIREEKERLREERKQEREKEKIEKLYKREEVDIGKTIGEYLGDEGSQSDYSEYDSYYGTQNRQDDYPDENESNYSDDYGYQPQDARGGSEFNEKELQDISDAMDKFTLYMNFPEQPSEQSSFEEEHHQEFEENAVRIPDVNRKPKSLENVSVNGYSNSEITDYIKGQCEIMEEATRHIDRAMDEYNEVTQKFSDIQLIDTAPDNIRRQIYEEAQRVDNLTVDRRIFKSGENKLSNNTYHRLEQLQDELPRGIKYLEKQENYYEIVKRDMRILEGEKTHLRLESESLISRQFAIKNIALAALIGLAVAFVVFFMALSNSSDAQNVSLYIIVAFLGAFLALGAIAILKYTERQVLVTEVKLNKVMALLNKTKIKYINAANTLDYEYNKYRVKSAYELEKKYQAYLDMKNEQRRVLHITTKLNEAEEDLLATLRKLGLYDAKIWLSQVKALINSNDMLDVRNELNSQRQKLRKQIGYNEKRIEDAKKNIKFIASRNPDCMPEALRIIENFDAKTAN